MRTTTVVLLMLASATLAQAQAQAPAQTGTQTQAPGPNGGQIVVADGHPIELVSTDKAITFYVRDEDNKPVRPEDLSAKAYVQQGGKTQTIQLTASAPNKLAGVLAAQLGPGTKIVLSGKIHGHAVQARFETK